jgi:hypothetical protein
LAPDANARDARRGHAPCFTGKGVRLLWLADPLDGRTSTASDLAGYVDNAQLIFPKFVA